MISISILGVCGKKRINPVLFHRDAAAGSNLLLRILPLKLRPRKVSCIIRFYGYRLCRKSIGYFNSDCTDGICFLKTAYACSFRMFMLGIEIYLPIGRTAGRIISVQTVITGPPFPFHPIAATAFGNKPVIMNSTSANRAGRFRNSFKVLVSVRLFYHSHIPHTVFGMMMIKRNLQNSPFRIYPAYAQNHK